MPILQSTSGQVLLLPATERAQLKPSHHPPHETSSGPQSVNSIISAHRECPKRPSDGHVPRAGSGKPSVLDPSADAPWFSLNTPLCVPIAIRQLSEFPPCSSSQHSPNAAWSQATEEQSECGLCLRILCKGLSDTKLGLREPGLISQEVLTLTSPVNTSSSLTA